MGRRGNRSFLCVATVKFKYFFLGGRLVVSGNKREGEGVAQNAGSWELGAWCRCSIVCSVRTCLGLVVPTVPCQVRRAREVDCAGGESR